MTYRISDERCAELEKEAALGYTKGRRGFGPQWVLDLLADRSDMKAELAKAKERIAELKHELNFEKGFNSELEKSNIKERDYWERHHAVLADRADMAAELAKAKELLAHAATVLEIYRGNHDALTLAARIRAVREGKEG